MRYGYLGPEGTFTQMALERVRDSSQGEHTAYSSVDAALTAVRSGDIDAAVVPIENSVEGGVNATLDALAIGEPLLVIGEVHVPITFVLAAPHGSELADVFAVGTHSHAWAQVRGWMSQHLPDATYVPTLSTAAAAAALAQGRREYAAAVSAPIAATSYGLAVLASDIGDDKDAVTRFVLVARPGALPEPTGADKTSVVLYQRENRAGGLLELLEQFAVRGINMTRLESRPTRRTLGSYCFAIDFDGHVHDERVGEALLGLKRVCADVRFLGSYPREDRAEVAIAPHTTNSDFIAAREWLRSLRHISRP